MIGQFLRHAVLALALFVAPLGVAQGQGVKFPPGSTNGGGSANLNLNNEGQTIGFGGAGGATAVAAGVSAGALGTPISLGTFTDDCAALALYVRPQSSSVRYQFSIRAGATTYIAENVYFATGAVGGYMKYPLLLKTTAGTEMFIATRASTAGALADFGLSCVKRNSQSAPGYTSMVALNADTANTRPSSTAVINDSSWVTIHTTAADYGAILVVTGPTASGLAAESKLVSIGLGATPTLLMSYPVYTNTAAPITPHSQGLPFEHTIPSGTAIKAKVDATTTANNLYIGVFGFIP